MHPLVAVSFALIYTISTIGTSIFLRSHFSLPSKDFATAGLLASKDFVLVLILFYVFEFKIKRIPHPLQYAFGMATIVFVATYFYWAYLSV